MTGLVTGTTGILGRVIVLVLLKQGKKVSAAKRSERNNLVSLEISLMNYEFPFGGEDPELLNGIDVADHAFCI